MNKKSKIIKEVGVVLCNHDLKRPWTIVGYGNCWLPAEKSTEHNISVIIAPFEKNHPYGVDLTQTVEVELPVGALSLNELSTKSIWEQNKCTSLRGRLDLSPNYQRLQLSDIHQKNPHPYELENIYNLNCFGQNQILNKISKSKYLRYECNHRGNELKVYISCVEILRKYYGTSSQFIKQTLSGQSADQSIFNPKGTAFIKNTDTHIVQLRSKIKDPDAAFAARIAFDKYAEDEFNNVFTNSFRTNVISNEHYLVAKPLVANPLKWDVEGVMLNNNEFWVTRLIRCNGKFPFSNLIFGRDNDGRSTKNRKSPNKINKFNKVSPSDKPKSIAATSLPNIDIDAVEHVMEESDLDRFSDLEDISISKIEKLTVEDPNSNVAVYDENQEDITEFLATAYASGKFGQASQVNISISQQLSQLEAQNTSKVIEKLRGWEYNFKCTHITFNDWKHDNYKWFNYIIFDKNKLKSSLKKISWIFNDPTVIDDFNDKEDKNKLNLMRIVLLRHSPSSDIDGKINGEFCYIEFLDPQLQLLSGKSSMLFGQEKSLNKSIIIEELLKFLKGPIDWSDKGNWEGKLRKKHRLVHHKKQSDNKVANKIFKTLVQMSF